MAEQESQPTLPPSRSAKFKRHPDTEAAVTDMTLGRRAEFRPSEQVAVRRDVIEAYRQRLVRDVAGTTDSEDVRDRAAFATVLADEATRHLDRAAMQLARMRRQREFWGEEWAVARRIHRRLGDAEVVSEALERAFVLSDGLEKALTGLEAARHGWEQGGAPKTVASWVRRIMSEFDHDGRKALHKMPKFTAAWAVQLATDAAVEAEHYDRAFVLMEAFVDHPELEARERQIVTATLGLWHYALGHPEEALRHLGAVGEQGGLDADFEDAWVSLMFSENDREGALRVLRRAAERVRQHGPAAVVLAQLERRAGQGRAAQQLLRAAADRGDDPIVLDLALDLLDQREGRSEHIDLLNRRLEVTDDIDRRVALLCRLGRLYEAEAGLEEAAADVYREALELVPDYAAAIRALGRLYSRRHNWHALVDLFEHEIESLRGSPTVWRRRFQVARLYENELLDLPAALAHYEAVLQAQPNYLPALKGAARILSETRQWAELADLFLKAAGTAVSDRQKLYLLDRVAEVAEQELSRFDVAIGAWEEILHMDPQHPRAFSSLGRLYVRTARWHELIDLNAREVELADDEEGASLLVRNAEIAEHELGRPDLAEQYYRQVLERLPDYLPALEGLGRIYARGGRWTEIVSMTDAQLGATKDPREVKRQLGALAEIFESHLERSGDAISVHERLLALDDDDAHAFHNLLRLYRAEGRWEDAFALIERHERPGYEGDLASIAEWRLEQWDTAFHWYLRALDTDPSNEHWLEGVARLWRPAKIGAGELADHLENLLMTQMDGALRDRYFLILARLREAAEGSPDAGRAYRAHGDTENLESLVVLRLAMAANGERKTLLEARRTRPVHPWDEVANADRCRPPEGMLDALATEAFDDTERRFIVRETDLGYSRAFVEPDDGEWTVLAAEMHRILSGPPEEDVAEEASPEFIRLRAVEALEEDDVERFINLSLHECEVTDSQQVRICRLVEIVDVVPASERDPYLSLVVDTAYPEVQGGELPEVVDGPVYDRLFDALQDHRAWEQLVQGLEAHANRDGVSNNRRIYLNAMLAEISEDQLHDFEQARQAFQRCWTLGDDPQYLRDLVRVATEEGDHELAVEWQAKHLEAMGEEEHPEEEQLESALWLADLLRAAGKGEEAAEQLESKLDLATESRLHTVARRELARLHADFGVPQRAVELFEQVLPMQATPADVDDWRTLIQLHELDLGDAASAYSLQWKLVRAQPTSERDLDDLIEAAFALGELPDCCAQLEALAGEFEGAAHVSLLGRAAVALDEDLNWAEEAARLYEPLLEATSDDEELHRSYRRRYAFCLTRIAGREAESLEEFRQLAGEEPFEPSTYRGIVDLLERTHSYDRARVANQLLVALGCDVDVEFERPKTTPSRDFEGQHVEEWLLPAELREGVLGALRSAMPIAEKIWSGELPQRKALDGQRIKDGPLFEIFVDALSAFGIRKFKLYTGDAGPISPQVLPDGTIWLNSDVIEPMDEAELRYVAGYCAALTFSDISTLLALDGRRVWHLLEGIQLKQTGHGFSERVDVLSQQLAEEAGGAFYTVARRRVMQSLEVAAPSLETAHCEAWPRAVEEFAYRVGLVLSGDVPAAARALLRLGGWEDDLSSPTTQARLRRTNGAEDLLRFAFSDAFLEARHVIGLAGRPSQLSV